MIDRIMNDCPDGPRFAASCSLLARAAVGRAHNIGRGCAKLSGKMGWGDTCTSLEQKEILCRVTSKV